ncbi:PTS IIA-like nitrogen regulatory protein PtsN [Metapseudomonas otitidis]|jgi:PTS system nitrogen regulatory IIA component|uniref:Nitrogen regulatory protein n=1 Tax=Metapseudomonas otitidis TaxID=319939 RepID=A0A679GKH4_9GAMM|nr:MULTISPECIES: PTS IIA-like nitrogen regulatory protein PtsN [Pseudomonas]MDL5596770.1 PTS IIA-like nitrogen regulatory protein PtsN [Bacillus subtilis]MBO2927578.1 PTS IIA-like nitrogen regulatory protein PtsN [Pseudomonas otitidis]MCO7554885.1 PTS IIA-like nitrogen regulatory protein PtsN [Pseudomonas otitidis]MDG9781663.1 PTS IIA-like nitrogen regulatory protein PtsN [Pseudomonas otitidis]MDH1108541.1 PTS IIA-like nitrogen regulatory protein PtsN [Pseudomonas otitidis]
MIRLEQILTPGRSLVNVPGGSKKRVLEQIANLVARDLVDLDSQDIFESLVAREKLGSTGFGNGIAIPHCRLQGCAAPVSAVLRLDAAVDFDAIDGAPVDLLFVLLVPEAATDEHLELLRQIASMLDRSDVRDRLRHAQDSENLYQVVVDVQNAQ